MPFYGFPDCPPPVRAQLERLILAFRAELGENLIGVYLHGSLAMGCFNPLRSDVDLLAVAGEPMAAGVKRRITQVLLDSSRGPAPLEISFLAREDLSPWRHPAPFDFHFSEDWRADLARAVEGDGWREWNAVRHCDPDLAGHITVTLHRGLVLYGAAIRGVFPPVPPADYLASVLADVLDPTFGLVSDLSNPVYVLLNGCRTLAYLRTGRVLSKAEGGAWALAELPAQIRPAIACALDAYRDRADAGDLDVTETAAAADVLRAEIVARVQTSEVAG